MSEGLNINRDPEVRASIVVAELEMTITDFIAEGFRKDEVSAALRKLADMVDNGTLE